MCGYDYKSGGCACKCFGPQKWDPEHPATFNNGNAVDWQAKHFPLQGRAAPAHKFGGIHKVAPLDKSHVIKTPGTRLQVDLNYAAGDRAVQPGPDNDCTTVSTVLQVVQGVNMQNCMRMCEDTPGCGCVSHTNGCKLFKSKMHTSKRYVMSYTGNDPANPHKAYSVNAQRLGLMNMMVPQSKK